MAGSWGPSWRLQSRLAACPLLWGDLCPGHTHTLTSSSSWAELRAKVEVQEVGTSGGGWGVLLPRRGRPAPPAVERLARVWQVPQESQGSPMSISGPGSLGPSGTDDVTPASPIWGTKRDWDSGHPSWDPGPSRPLLGPPARGRSSFSNKGVNLCAPSRVFPGQWAGGGGRGQLRG